MADVEKGTTVAIFGLGAVGLAVSLEDLYIIHICDSSLFYRSVCYSLK